MESLLSRQYARISRRTFMRVGAVSVPLLLGVQGEAAALESSAAGIVRADWPVFLGPTRNNISQETGLLQEWPEEGPPLAWQRGVGEGYGPPVVARDRLVVFHRLGNEEMVECIDARQGKRVHWKYAYPTSYRDQYGYSGGPRSSPCIEEDQVYSYGAEGVLTCLNFETGALVWQRPVIKEFNVPQGFFGAGVAPVVDGGLVFINVGGPKGAGVVAFDAETGKIIWKTSNDKASYSTPIVATLRGTRMVIFHTADGLLVVEARTGKELYSYPFRSKIYESAIAATPVLVGDKVFLSGAYQIGAVLLQLAPEGLKVIWRDEYALQSHWATSVYHEGYLYGMDGRHERGSNFRCLEFDTGKVVWTVDKRLGRASFFMAEGHLVALGERGRLALIEASPEGYKEKARIRVPGARRRVWTPPILAQGLLYIRTDREITCFDLRAMS